MSLLAVLFVLAVVGLAFYLNSLLDKRAEKRNNSLKTKTTGRPQ
ncbi:MAG TPA: hypothetical protein VFR80_06970 [Pyrinomonadaceae bacterium]|nr:hypothetical protein [Pyrinomonadaceae bacterium]